MQLGDLKLTLVDDGGFRLDGGAMFGVVPKVMWEKKKAPDEKNRIPMVTNSLLVERGNELLLIDSGVGDKGDDRFRSMFGLQEGSRRLPAAIQDAGYELGDITHVLLSHLHFDHCGWNTREENGRLVPTFPKARYFISRGELTHARKPNVRDAASYDPRNWEPLLDAGVVELFDGECEPLPGIRAIPAPGHNADMCIVRLDGGNEKAQGVFWADLVPTVAHVAYPWVMGFDLFPLQTIENKQKWLPQAADGDWLCIFVHEDEHPAGRLVEVKPGRYRSEPVES